MKNLSCLSILFQVKIKNIYASVIFMFFCLIKFTTIIYFVSFLIEFEKGKAVVGAGNNVSDAVGSSSGSGSSSQSQPMSCD